MGEGRHRSGYGMGSSISILCPTLFRILVKFFSTFPRRNKLVFSSLNNSNDETLDMCSKGVNVTRLDSSGSHLVGVELGHQQIWSFMAGTHG